MRYFAAITATVGLLTMPVLPAQNASACGPNRNCPYQNVQYRNGPNRDANQNQSQIRQNQNRTANQNQQNQNQQNQNQQNQNQQNENQQNQNQQNQNQQNQNQQNQTNQQNQAVAIPVGSRITLPGDYGLEMGAVFLVVGGIKLPMVVESWDTAGITLTLPQMEITSAQQVKLEVRRVDGGQTATVDITLNPVPKIIVLDKPVDMPAQTADVAPAAPQIDG